MPELVGIKRPPLDNGVAMIGYSYGNFPELDFLSDSNLYEYGTLIVDPQTINHELGSKLINFRALTIRS